MRVLLPLIFFVGCLPDPSVDPLGDPDADGLTNQEEADLGTNPDSADSDGDSFNDKEEIDGGYSALWMYSHPFEEGDYLIGNCPVHPDEANAGPTGTGSYSTTEWDTYAEGDVVANLVNHDAFEQEVSLYSFCGNYTVVNQSAEWCGPCQMLALVMHEDQEKIRKSFPNFAFYELLYQDASSDRGEPNKRVLNDWTDTFGLDGIPVVAPEDNQSEEMSWINGTGSIPSTLLLAPDMTVIWAAIDNPGEYYLSNTRSILDAIREYESEQGEN